jgi:hypothetical protein
VRVRRPPGHHGADNCTQTSARSSSRSTCVPTPLPTPPPQLMCAQTKYTPNRTRDLFVYETCCTQQKETEAILWGGERWHPHVALFSLTSRALRSQSAHRYCTRTFARSTSCRDQPHTLSWIPCLPALSACWNGARTVERLAEGCILKAPSSCVYLRYNGTNSCMRCCINSYVATPPPSWYKAWTVLSSIMSNISCKYRSRAGTPARRWTA